MDIEKMSQVVVVDDDDDDDDDIEEEEEYSQYNRFERTMKCADFTRVVQFDGQRREVVEEEEEEEEEEGGGGREMEHGLQELTKKKKKKKSLSLFRRKRQYEVLPFARVGDMDFNVMVNFLIAMHPEAGKEKSSADRLRTQFKNASVKKKTIVINAALSAAKLQGRFDLLDTFGPQLPVELL